MENYQFTPSDIYIPPEPNSKEIAIYGHTKEVVYKRKTSNHLIITATVSHFLSTSCIRVRVEDEDSYVNAINVHMWGINHERYSDLFAQNYLESPELYSICVNFDKLCVPMVASEAQDVETIISLNQKESFVYE